MIYRYDGVKIKDGWTHPLTGTVYTKANWFDSQSPEQLEAFGVTRHGAPLKPDFDSFYQEVIENAAGNYSVQDLPLETVKERKKAQINAIRDELEITGFNHNGVTFDSDQRSADRIQIATIAANASLITSTAFAVEWRAADNSEHQFDAAGMLALTQSFAGHGLALHEQAKQLKIAVDAAQTVADVVAIEWGAQ